MFLSGLLISDEPVFEFGVHMLRIFGESDGLIFSYTRGVQSGFANDTTKKVSEAEAVQTLDLFLKLKYGLDLSVRRVIK
jgi:hypothetical protein